MGIKSFTTLALAAATVAGLSIAPAEAGNNNKYLNQLAMQMYAQNQAQAYNPYGYGGAVPYGNYAVGNGYNGQTPWSAGAMPYAYGSGNPYGNIYGRYRNPHAYYHHNRWH
ncbi:MAG: hypothetical protein KGS72_16000 [Cyanobacteria bacterium REEB67]|nr:hypothetical protein [Cyanobacteria bacterium REEB67]